MAVGHEPRIVIISHLCTEVHKKGEKCKLFMRMDPKDVLLSSPSLYTSAESNLVVF